jgi:anoctamin-5
MSDYMELVIQYGYVVLFSASFTLTPLLAYFLNLFEIRVDAAKM